MAGVGKIASGPPRKEAWSSLDNQSTINDYFIMQIAISDFKAKCLSMLDDLYQHGGQILLTKRGKVIAQIQPVQEEGPLRRELEGVQMRPDWR